MNTPAARRGLRHNVIYVKATTAYVTMTRTELISAPASWTQCVFQRLFFLSGFAIFINWTLNRKLFIDMKLFVQETRPISVKKYLFRDNAVAA